MDEKKRSINRLKSMYPLRAKVNEGYKKTLEAMEEGKPVGWAMVNYWEADPIFKAMDIDVVYPENYGAVCATSEAGTYYLDLADSEGYPTHLCGYSRICYGYASRMAELGGQIPPEAPMGGMPKPAFLLSSGLICDARVKWFQGLGRYLDAPVWMMETATPGVEEWFARGTRDKIVDFIKREITEFVKFMERIAGKKMDWDRYDETINDMIKLCRLVHETFELRKAVPSPMHSKDFWSCMPSFLFLFGDLKDSINCFRDMNDEIKQRIENNYGAVDSEKYRLSFGDIPPWHSLDFFDRLAERGWNFVKESWGYNPPLPIPDLESISDPVERHAKFHLHFTTGHYPDAFKDKEYMGYIGYPYLSFAKEFKTHGAVWHPLITCRSASTHHPYATKLLMDKAGVPSLSLEGDLVDLRLFDPEDAIKKAEAFEEIMDHCKEERKKKGYDW